MTTRTIIIIISFLASLKSIQAFSPIDTVNLAGVQVIAARHQLFHEGTMAWHFDSMTIASFRGLSLGEMISECLPFPVMQYGGQGALSGILMRGTSSSQTAVAWNGFPINSLTAGGTDLSLIHAGAVDDVSINAGIPGSVYGYGNIGGVLFLSNLPDYDNRLNINGQYSVGSFNTSRQLLSVKAGSQQWQMHLALFRQNAENDFVFNDIYKPGSPRVRQSHNALNFSGFSQSSFLKLSRNRQLELGIWYQWRNKEIPPIMGSYQPGTAAQKDSVTRIYAGYTQKFARSVFRLKSAFFDEFLRYTDKQNPSADEYSVDSRIRTRQWLGSAEYRWYIHDHLVADGGITGSLADARVKSYGSEVNENRLGLFTGVRLSYPRWTLNLSLLKEWVNHHDPSLQLALNGHISLVAERLSLRAKLANHYRIPAMNDKYWQPGGNPDLKPEHGGGGDAGMSLVLPLHGIVNRLEAELTVYSLLVNDWIQWVPGTSFWHVENYLQVWSRGMESRMAIHGEAGWLRWEAEASYFYTRSGPRISGEEPSTQLPYIPKHSGATHITLQSGWMRLAWYHNFCSRKYSTSDNTESFAVPACYMSNLFVGWTFAKADFRPELSIQVHNLFNRSYESIRSIAMPGRYIMLNLVLTCQKKEKKK